MGRNSYHLLHDLPHLTVSGSFGSDERHIKTVQGLNSNDPIITTVQSLMNLPDVMLIKDYNVETRKTSQAQRPTSAPRSSLTLARYLNLLPYWSVRFDSL